MTGLHGLVDGRFEALAWRVAIVLDGQVRREHVKEGQVRGVIVEVGESVRRFRHDQDAVWPEDVPERPERLKSLADRHVLENGEQQDDGGRRVPFHDRPEEGLWLHSCDSGVGDPHDAHARFGRAHA